MEFGLANFLSEAEEAESEDNRNLKYVQILNFHRKMESCLTKFSKFVKFVRYAITLEIPMWSAF